MRYYFNVICIRFNKPKGQEAFYIGMFQNVQNRLRQHNAGMVKSTKSRRPFFITYIEKCTYVETVRKREKYFNTGAGRRWRRKYYSRCSTTWTSQLDKPACVRLPARAMSGWDSPCLNNFGQAGYAL